jgi:FkbM family methyltransferase
MEKIVPQSSALGTKIRRSLIKYPALRTVLAAPLAVRNAFKHRDRDKFHLVVDRLQSLLAEDVVLKVPEFSGIYHCSPKSHLFTRLLHFGSYEPELAQIFLSYVTEDRDVIDVGANIGFYTVAAARKLTTGRVLAIEPTTGAHERLIRNIDRNGVVDKVEVFKGLASDHIGDADMHSIPGMEEYSSIAPLVHSSVTKQSFEKSSSPVSTIDELVKARKLNPSIIKVDVEGAEGLVFAGARETIKTFRPVILSELAPELLSAFGTTPAGIIAMFDEFDYVVIDPLDPLIPAGHRQPGDILCIPREMAERADPALVVGGKA